MSAIRIYPLLLCDGDWWRVEEGVPSILASGVSFFRTSNKKANTPGPKLNTRHHSRYDYTHLICVADPAEADQESLTEQEEENVAAVPPFPRPHMGSIVQNGWDQQTEHYTTSIALTLLYYDYVLTFDRERRLVWSQWSFKQWGSVLFFLNRYCGVIGHIPVIILKFSPPGTPSHRLCNPLESYHQILAVVMQAIVGATFITRTYALYDRSRVVLITLTSLALAGVAVGGYMLTHGQKLAAEPMLPEGSIGCSRGLSWSQSWRLAVAWSTVMIFDLVVVVVTLVRTIQINRRSGRSYTLTRVLIRDGVVYFGVISLATLCNIITFLRGSEITRGVATTMTNILASVLVSRLMFNLREQREPSATTLTATGSTPMSTTILHTLTNIEDIDAAAILDVPNHHRDIEMVRIGGDDKRGDDPTL